MIGFAVCVFFTPSIMTVEYVVKKCTVFSINSLCLMGVDAVVDSTLFDQCNISLFLRALVFWGSSEQGM